MEGDWSWDGGYHYVVRAEYIKNTAEKYSILPFNLFSYTPPKKLSNNLLSNNLFLTKVNYLCYINSSRS